MKTENLPSVLVLDLPQPRFGIFGPALRALRLLVPIGLCALCPEFSVPLNPLLVGHRLLLIFFRSLQRRFKFFQPLIFGRLRLLKCLGSGRKLNRPDFLFFRPNSIPHSGEAGRIEPRNSILSRRVYGSVVRFVSQDRGDRVFPIINANIYEPRVLRRRALGKAISWVDLDSIPLLCFHEIGVVESYAGVIREGANDHQQDSRDDCFHNLVTHSFHAA